MRVVYSVNAKFGGPGIGTTAYHAARGIFGAGELERLFVNSNAQQFIPASLIRQWGTLGRGIKYLAAKDSTGLIFTFENALFDRWVAAQLPQGDIFHGWNALCLHSLRRAHALGMKTVVERASSHPATHRRLVEEEYARWQVPLKFPRWNHRRMVQEFQETDFITVPSAFASASMLAEGVPAEKLIEIPFGVDPERFSPPPQRSQHPFRVIFAGSISINKGVPYLLEAWQQLHWDDAELWMVGAMAPDMQKIRQRWNGLPGVKFISHTNDLPNLFRACDVFVFPSIQEGSALVTYEAMACGLPVVTTLNAGSVVREGIEGFIVPIRETDTLVERMRELRQDSALCERMRVAAIDRAREYTWDVYRARLLQAYGRIGAEG